MATIIKAGNTTDGLALTADNTGILELKTGTGAGTTAVTISTAQAVTFAGNVSGVIKSGTAVASTSGTSIDFTGIPSTAKRVTVMFSGVSTSGTSNPLIQLGDAGGIENTVYVATSTNQSGTVASYTTGFGINNASAAAILHGSIIISLLNSATNTWAIQGAICAAAVSGSYYVAGAKSLSDVLTQVRITTVNGTDTFDAGSINILYE
jgi:hypothetical protein